MLKRTIADTLANIDEAFEAIRLPTDYSMVPRATLRGMLRMGPWVPFEPLTTYESERLCAVEKWPGLLFLSRGSRSEWFDGVDTIDEGPLGMLTLVYAIKMDKSPWYVERKPGVHYEFGIAYRYKKRLQWFLSHIAIDAISGEMISCAELFSRPVIVKHGRHRGQAYSRREWANPVVEEASAWGPTVEERERHLCKLFAASVQWWLKRNERWTIAVRRNGSRVTFSVEPAYTKTYFADRAIEAVTPSGQRKKIIHYVRAHQRTIAARNVEVREHIRGVREFSWRGFQCAVTAPEFHTWSAAYYDIGAHAASDVIGRRVVDVGTVAAALADAEDYQSLPHVKAGTMMTERRAQILEGA